VKDALEKILSYLAVYIPDLVRLVSGPKAFVAKRNKETERNLAKAFTFLVLSLAIFFVLQWGFVIPGRENSTDALVHGIMYVFFVLVFSAILRLSWRIVGGKADYQRFAITTAYYVGICLVPL
jgi:protein-S-isoprenylcysteine O-methyltransferase Ste14